MWKAWQVNEMDAGKILTKKPAAWLRSATAVRFVKTLVKKLKVQKSHLLKSFMGRGEGTYAHWQIALAYAKYLSPEFHIWCNDVVKDRFELMADPRYDLPSALPGRCDVKNH